MPQSFRIYLLTRLYNIDDKIRACLLEQKLKENFSCSVYMPYRDSREEEINKQNWKEEIFRIDIEEINNADLLIGFLDGPEFDEGVGFEIGYAITLGKKVILINSDFISYSPFYKTELDSTLPDNLLKMLDIKWINYFPDINFDTFCNSLKENREDMLSLAHIFFP
jgi:nucleoside 2-deoxyribosyltransferase